MRADLQSQKGETGVELRFYKPNEYRCLTKEQKKELKQMREAANENGNDKGKEKPGPKNKKKKANKAAQQFIAAITEQLSSYEEKENSEFDDYKELIIAAMNEANNDPKATAQKLIEKGTKAEKSVNELKTILKRNGKYTRK